MKVSKSLFSLVAVLMFGDAASANSNPPLVIKKATTVENRAPAEKEAPKASDLTTIGGNFFYTDDSNGDHAGGLALKLQRNLVRANSTGMAILDSQAQLNAGWGSAKVDDKLKEGFSGGGNVELNGSAKAIPTTCAPIVSLGAKAGGQYHAGYGGQSDINYRAGAGLGCTFKDGRYVLLTFNAGKGASSHQGVDNYDAIGLRGLAAVGSAIYLSGEYTEKNGETLKETETKGGAILAFPNHTYFGMDAGVTNRKSKSGLPMTDSPTPANAVQFGISFGGAFSAL